MKQRTWQKQASAIKSWVIRFLMVYYQTPTTKTGEELANPWDIGHKIALHRTFCPGWLSGVEQSVMFTSQTVSSAKYLVIITNPKQLPLRTYARTWKKVTHTSTSNSTFPDNDLKRCPSDYGWCCKIDHHEIQTNETYATIITWTPLV